WLTTAHDEHADAKLLIRKGVGPRREDRANFEQPDVSLHSREVVFGASGQRVENLTAQIGLVLGKRICQPYESFAAGDEWHRTRLEQPGPAERLTHALRRDPLWIIRNVARTERPNISRKAIVPAQPRDL